MPICEHKDAENGSWEDTNAKIRLSSFGVVSDVKNQSLPLGNFHGDYCYNKLLSDGVVTW